MSTCNGLLKKGLVPNKEIKWKKKQLVSRRKQGNGCGLRMPVILGFVDKLAKVHGRRWRERKEAKYSFAKGILYRGRPS